MEIENKLFQLYKEYIKTNSQFSPEVFNDTPQELSKFPTVIFTENNNKDSRFGKTTNKIEYTDDLQYKIEIYTKNTTIGNKLYARKTITNELKYLTFEFLSKCNITRTDCRKAEYLDLSVDRTVILGECNINSWNGKIV